MVSLIEDKSMKHSRSFYYWAAFISHGFASVRLDDALLDQIHKRLLEHQEKPSGDNNTSRDDDDTNKTLEMAILTLTRDAYHRLEEQEETLSREWCEKWNAAKQD